MTKPLAGRRILVVEDEYLEALDMSRMVEAWGGEVAALTRRLDRARALARSERLDGAVLNVDLNGESVLSLADLLIDKGVPVVLATGYDPGMLPRRFDDLPRLAKPYTESAGKTVLCRAFSGG